MPRPTAYLEALKAFLPSTFPTLVQESLHLPPWPPHPDPVYVPLRVVEGAPGDGMTRGPAALEQPLEGAWSRLRRALTSERDPHPGDDDRLAFANDQIITRIGRHHRVILLGEPGCGKTTAIRHLAYLLVAAFDDGDVRAALERVGLKPPCVPIWISLSDFGKWWAWQSGSTPDRLGAFLRWAYCLEADEVADVLGWLESGKAIFLLDGLDEMPRAGSKRGNAFQDLWRTCQAFYDRCPVVLTSRPSEEPALSPLLGVMATGQRTGKLFDLGRDAAAHEAVRCFTIAPLEPEEALAVLSRWTSLCARGTDAAGPPLELLDDFARFQQRPGLASNPLWIVLMVLAYLKTGQIHETVTDLYAACISVLTATAAPDAGADPRPADPPGAAGRAPPRLSADDWIVLAAWVAFHTHRADTSDARKRPTLNQLLKRDDVPVDIPRRWQPHVGRELERRGLVHGASGGRPAHVVDLGLREHLAAEYIMRSAERSETTLFATIKPYLTDVRWREVIGGALALQGKRSSDMSARVLDLAVDAVIGGDLDPRARMTACATLAHASRGVERIGAAIRDRLVGLWIGALARVEPHAPVDRREIGRGLAHLGDPRVSRDAYAFCPLSVPRSKVIGIGRYPVTVGQFRAFAEAMGDGWRQASSDRAAWSRMLKGLASNEPIRGVTWQEASDYCRWASENVRPLHFEHARTRFALPTRAIWLYAAGADDAERLPRLHPWGPGVVRGRAAVFDEGFRAPGPVAVGLFPGGDALSEHGEGPSDLAGNVWEWVADRSSVGLARAFGGSWSSPPCDLRFGTYLEGYPDRRYATVGFRCTLERL